MLNLSLDKLRGYLIGVFLGDALGAPHEFRYQTDVYTGILQYKSKITLRTGSKYMAIGQLTDDSEMTLILLRRILEDANDGKINYDKDNIILDYIEWANSNPAGIGINTQYLFKGIKAKDSTRRLSTYNNRYYNKKEAQRYGKIEKRGFGWPEDDWSQSNGCLMRCSPLVLFDDLSIVDSDCKITNPHPVNTVINKLYIIILKNSIMGVPPIESFNFVINIIFDKDASKILGDIKIPVIEVLNQISADYQKYKISGVIETSRNVKFNKGWILNSFYVAVMALLIFDSMEAGLNWVISLGGDTDTNAAIAGALIGGSLGYQKILDEPKTNNNINILLNSDTTEGDFARNKKYTINDFMSLTSDIINIMN